ncbi:carbon-nitrogen hydrolase family protein [Aquabacterium sp. A7-Y]|uniref:carbon-nitrogen hydrolase family protein n=1 Tax=Aquabacterium sp. A7-Y TaxID=1349605 RepID=UPI00223D60EE|nr:carbon-nitrogen hydrolase family protein [Aquabacterium sp. A7-Y]MCW7536657.1 carbon-nitrogen hydrolase family protein [Aquabacterium sp. A7-Y]
MKIAALQMVSSCSPEDNLERARRLIARAAAEGAQLVALPENFAFMGHDDRDKLALAEALGQGPAQQMLSEAAREHGVWLIGGSIAVATEDPERVGNTTLVYDPAGERVARYDKIHLFRFEEHTPTGSRLYDEALVLRAGATPTAVEVRLDDGAWRVGLSICYDLRFPELYRQLMVPPCDLIVVPSAFTWPTGHAHWELLLRARAVENQCYVMAPAQGGRHENGRRTWGHTLIADPWGELLAVHEEGEGLVCAELSRARLAEVRAKLPALAHRRLG